MIIKVCGMREGANIHDVEHTVAPTWMGFIFYPPSSRYVSSLPYYLPKTCKRVGVFVNAEIEDIIRHVADFGLNAVQLHGKETTDYIVRLRPQLPPHTLIIKAVHVNDSGTFSQLTPYDPLVDYYLFETPTQSYGGSGRKFDWTLLHNYHGSVPFLLTGGITSSDSAAIRQFTHPHLAGIDLNSGFETAPAVKDPHLLATFIKQILP